MSSLETDPAESSLADADLARRVTAAAPGEALAAETELYRRLAPRVELYGLRHLRAEQAAADLVQQVLVLTIERLREGRVREPERLASYVLGVCRMVVLDLKRGEGRRKRALERYAADVPMAESSSSPRVDLDRLASCLDRLHERERSVLVLTFYSERSATEVAAELGLSPGNVRVIRHRALGRLRECMSGELSAP
ncbi:MAG: sigma-70 family RNA polymerase sigma factor [Candidatus Rokubacteria bacterium]|nr:sigma-70 family RNA polymerase sigma factor [Candidatus Rokubacteria bacterium]